MSCAPWVDDFQWIGANLVQCRADPGRLFTLLLSGDALTRFVAPRLITTVLAVIAIAAVCTAVLART